MLSKTGFRLLFLVCLLVACQDEPVVTETALPTVTETREEVIAAATPTLPTSTPIPPTSTFTFTPTPSRTPHPTNTPTVPPTITPTPVPTLIPVTPLPSPGNYTLKPWAEQEALNVMALLENAWQEFNAENDGVYVLWGVNYGRSYLALFKQETLWRFPDTEHRLNLEWQIAYDLAMAGNQEASTRLIPLLEQELDSQNAAEPDITFLQSKGFTPQLFAAANLFSDGQMGWVLALGKQTTSSYTNEDGAVFALRHAQGSYSISPVASFWEAFHGDEFIISVGDHTNDNLPEIIIERSIVSGNGPNFGGTSICIYQWATNAWQSLLNEADGSCLTYGGYHYPLVHKQSATEMVAQLDVTAIFSTGAWGFCNWFVHLNFDWNGTEYIRTDIWIDIPTYFSHADDLLCLNEAWRVAKLTGDSEKLLVFMESILANWSRTQQINQFVRDWIKFDTEFPWIFRFQLGRYYALTGDLAKAEPLLTEVANQPLANFEAPWPTMAQTYLDNLGDLDQAEQLLTEFNTSLLPIWTPTTSTWVNVDEVSLELADRLFVGDDPQAIITELETLIAEQCTANHYCDQPYYILGLTYEAAGDEANAVAAYWQVWHDYPDSYYATIAQYRLVEKE